MRKILFIILGAAFVLASCESTKPALEKSEAAIGDYYYSGGSYASTLLSSKTPEGIVFWLNAGNKSSKITAFNAQFSADGVGGMAMRLNQYWSSTNHSSTNSISTNFALGKSWHEHVYSLFHVRAIASI